MAEPIKYVSPSGALIDGTLEKIFGKALLNGIDPDTGEPEYEGETEVFWDDQCTVQRDNKIVFLDVNGAEWAFDQLHPVGHRENCQSGRGEWSGSEAARESGWFCDECRGFIKSGGK